MYNGDEYARTIHDGEGLGKAFASLTDGSWRRQVCVAFSVSNRRKL